MPNAPFRADHVGSFLRPKQLLEARDKRERGEIGPGELRRVEDAAIREVVKQQENVGLKSITDGEFRRTFFHVDFLEQLGGVTVAYNEYAAKFRKDDGSEVGFKPPTIHISGKIAHERPIQGADFDFLKSVVTKRAKVTIPSPSMLHFRGGRKAIDEKIYPDLKQFYADLAAAYAARSPTWRRGAAATCNWTTPIWPICAIPKSAPLPKRGAMIPMP